MLTKNNWVTSNIKQRIEDPSLDFQVILNPYEFEKVDFKTAARNVAIEIGEKYDNLFLGLSGGLDSEFLLRLFVGLGIQIQPVIVSNYSNRHETAFAFRACDELKIKPVVIEPNDPKTFYVFKKYIFEKFKIAATYSVFSLIAADYVYERNGVLITGNHLIGDAGDPLDTLCSNDWDFHTEVLYEGLVNIDPLMYTPQIAYACINGITEDWNIHKAKLFEIAIREKLRPIYSQTLENRMDQLLMSRTHRPNHNCSWKANEVFNNIS